MKRRLALTLLVGLALGAAGVAVGAWLLRPKLTGTRFEQGREVAHRMGCFACHGPDGRVGTTNYLPDIDEVPSWNRGAMNAYVKSPEEVEEWILDGIAERMRDDPQEKQRVAKQLIKMPAYRDLLTAEEIDALVLYVRATGTLSPRDEDSPASRGREIATRMGCFGCHGPEGRARTPNPGSFKGYIPSWDSKDFDELVNGPVELKEWILAGAPNRLRGNPAAAFFLKRQVIQMPAYADRVTPAELEDLSAYVLLIRHGPPREASLRRP